MRRKRGWLGVMASLAGFLAGANASDEAASEAERGRAPAQRQGREAAGLAASGPGFYVWDEDGVAARRWAAELAQGAPLVETSSEEDLDRSPT